MRKLFLGLIILPLQTLAFFSNTEIERETMRIEIEANEQQTSFSIFESLKNATDKPQKTQVFWPSKKFNDVHFFVDAAGENFDILTGEEKNLVAFENAKISRNPAFFIFGETDKMFRSAELTISPNSEIEIKIKFNTQTQKFENFKQVEIFTTDNIESKNFELAFRLNSTSKIEHFFSTLPKSALIEKEKNSVTIFGNFQKLKPLENFRIFWSTIKNPLLEFTTKDARYFGHLIETPAPKNFEEITILIDRSGSMNDNWSRVRELIEFLTNFFENKKLKIIVFNDSVKFFDGENFLILETDSPEKTKADFVQNSFDFRKNFFGKWNAITAVSKANSENLFKNADLFNKNSIQQAVFLISDMTELDGLEKNSAPLFFLNFSNDIDNHLTVLAEDSGGFSQKIFKNSSNFIEKDDFLEKWQNIYQPVSPNFEILKNETDLTPSEIKKFSLKNSPLFVGRKFEDWGIMKNSLWNFLPRVWAKSRIANLLKTQNISDETIDAILSIGKTFGVKTELFNENTPRSEFKKTINKNEFLTKLEINNLENSEKLTPNSNAKFINSIPFYYNESGNYWRQEGFENLANEKTLVKIAPFSAAQKNLFLQFPNFLSKNFAIGQNIDFCIAFRCFSIQDKGRTESIIEDRNFLRDFNSNYWANPFLEELILKGVIETEKNGKLRANAPLDRGEFLNILGNYFFEKEIIDFIKPSVSKFLDVKKDSEFFDSVEFFANQKIIKGFPDGTFRPKQNITRAETIKILTSVLGFIPDEKTKSADAIFSDTISWEKPFVNFAAQNEIISGFSDKLFHPEKNISKAEAAKMIVLGKKLRKK